MYCKKAGKIREHFPFISKYKEGEVIYFDNAATTHKPEAVLNSIANYYTHTNSNIHRSAHSLGSQATREYELARKTIAKFIGAKNEKEVVFTSGATESINLVADSFVRHLVGKKDVILTTEIEHHSNFLPWQRLSKKTGCTLKTIAFDDNFKLDVSNPQLINSNVRFIAIHHVSNVTGCVQNLKELIRTAKKLNIPVLIDGAQAVSHLNINVSELDCDFYCFSGHKLFGPTGTGVLYAKCEKMQALSPYRVGGGMVSLASLNKSVWEESPMHLESGTPNICGSIALASAVDYIFKIGLDNILKHEMMLTEHACSVLEKIPNIIFYRSSQSSIPIFSFNIQGLHHYDISSLLAENNIYVRSGHLCCQPLMSHLNIDGCLRVSLSMYNTVGEINKFGKVLLKVVKFLS